MLLNQNSDTWLFFHQHKRKQQLSELCRNGLQGVWMTGMTGESKSLPKHQTNLSPLPHKILQQSFCLQQWRQCYKWYGISKKQIHEKQHNFYTQLQEKKKKKAILLGSRADTKQTKCLFGILILILTQATANPSHPKWLRSQYHVLWCSVIDWAGKWLIQVVNVHIQPHSAIIIQVHVHTGTENWAFSLPPLSEPIFPCKIVLIAPE